MEDTSQIRDPQMNPENLKKLEGYLAKNLPNFKGPLTARQFNSGQSNPTFLLSTPSQHYVLRKKPPGKLLPSAHAIDREFLVISKLQKTDVPVPKAYLYCKDLSVIGNEFYIMEFVNGRIFKTATLAGMSNEERGQIFDEVIKVLAKLHRVDWKGVGLGEYGKPGSYYERQIAVWTRMYKATETHEIPSMNKLMEWLPAHLPADDGWTSVVHGDFRPDNMIFHPTENRVIAVLDWELSTIGHPLGDLGYMSLPFNFEPVADGRPALVTGIRGIEKLLGLPTLDEYVARYCELTGRKDIPDWHFYQAFALFRLTSICQGVYKRALSGNASSKTAKETGAQASFIADRAWAIVEEAESKRGPSRPVHQKASTEHSVFAAADSVKDLRTKLLKFMDEHVYPNETVYAKQHKALPDRWMVPPIIEDLKQKAKDAGLWNLFLPHPPKHLTGVHVPGLTNLQYAPLCEIMGRSLIAPEVFNCNAPDTGNMEVLSQYGNKEQQEKWLRPLLNGEIRSCFSMTEPHVASSDATNISCRITRSGDKYIVNGRKWYISGAGHPHCKVTILLGLSDPENPNRYRQQSMILVPMDAKGVTIVRPCGVFGYDDAPHGHCEIIYDNVEVPLGNMILGEGRGFEIAQGRLGPGRIHHCMRLIGLSERSLELMITRAKSRVAFKKQLAQQGTVRTHVAEARIAIDQARLLTFQAAHLMDTKGNKAARAEIAMIKVVAPRMACQVVDSAIQVHGAGGLSDDFPLGMFYASARSLRLADGPDEVHLEAIARLELSKLAESASAEETAFHQAQKLIIELDPTPQELLDLYGWYQQATNGDNNAAKPTSDAKSVAKWQSWADHKGISKPDAQRQYASYVAAMKKDRSASKAKL